MLFGNLKIQDALKGIINKKVISVDYFSQPKACIWGDKMHKVFSKIDRQLRTIGQSVILFMDNAGCHPLFKKKRMQISK